VSAPSWLNVSSRLVGPTKLLTGGQAEIPVAIRCTISWRKPGYWQWMRDQLETTPCWLAWPIAIYLGIRLAWRLR